MLQGITAKQSFYSLPHFVAFIMIYILQSEESEIELNTENSPDWRKSYKIPHFAWFSVYLAPTIWGIWFWNLNFRLKVIRGNSSLCMFLSKTKSYNLRNLNLNRKPPLPQIEGYQKNSPLCRFFLQWNPTIWGIDSPFSGEMRTITILSSLYHELQGIAAKHSFYSLPHFVAFIMVIILQSEESEIELNTENSSDWRKSNKIPHLVWFLVYLTPKMWGI